MIQVEPWRSEATGQIEVGTRSARRLPPRHDGERPHAKKGVKHKATPCRTRCASAVASSRISWCSAAQALLSGDWQHRGRWRRARSERGNLL